MAVTLLQLRKAIGQYLSQDKPEPHLILQFPDSIELSAIDWLKSSGAVWQRGFWVISRENAKEALFPSPIDWNTHWKNEEKRMKQRIKEGLNVNSEDN